MSLIQNEETHISSPGILTPTSLPGMTPTSLQLPQNLIYEEWETVGRGLQRISGGVMWWIGDWWTYGEHSYGERASQFFNPDEDRYAFQTCMNAGWVSRSIETSRRREVLTWSHHSEVAGLEPAEQDLLLSAAVNENWTKREIRRQARRVKAARLSRQSLEFPKGKYRVFYADPPWEYGNEQPAYHTEQANHYPLMSTEEICAMPVKDISEENAVLFLWTTSAMLPEAMLVAESWGFEYKTSFVWDKIKHNMGHYNSVRHELLLVCVRGSCPPDEQKLFDSVVSIERGEHSEKPEYFRTIIDTIYPFGARIELFGRKVVDGWTIYGNETTLSQLQRS